MITRRSALRQQVERDRQLAAQLSQEEQEGQEGQGEEGMEMSDESGNEGYTKHKEYERALAQQSLLLPNGKRAINKTISPRFQALLPPPSPSSQFTEQYKAV
ncbi:hypothetical protein K469DRAFT_695495 [Zopfia rhizophila CBS 207.26]|uniref:Uncharacterized protein n=1 Tax=Zopfia rhizophila CBS 207.26 TaxID=1314779 RepID=A0A6A6DH26_9PEZI|nr:hypothetical protein K469DRAFT_695495 [Zopfia rhizophila CBS 207.26]